MDRDASSVLGRPYLELRGVSVSRADVPILAGVDLVVPVDARTVVLGPNGAGKTTMLQAIHGLLPLTTGSVRGLTATRADVCFRFGFVFQRPVMLHRSAIANIEHALAIAGIRAGERRALAARALADVGLDYVADRPARRLSGGEQQRLAVARANALEPDCLLLDEPASSLDPAAAAALERYLLRLSARGRGIVMATHDLAQARRLAEIVVFMHRGRVEEVAPAGDFFDGPRSPLARRFLAGEWLE